MENKFNQQDSLQLINQMINTAKGNLQKGAGNYFLLWGYVVVIACIIQFIWMQFSLHNGISYSSYVWGITFGIGIVATIFLIIKDKRKDRVKTYTDSIISTIWIGFMGGVFLISFLLSGKYGVFISPAILFLYSFALLVSATAYKLKWMYIPTAVCLICVLLHKVLPFSYAPLLMAIALTAGNIIPGHILNKKAKKNV